MQREQEFEINDLIQGFPERKLACELSRRLQSSIALSSAESRINALRSSGMAEMLRVGSLLRFLVGANEARVTAFSDSSAACGLAQRAGGKPKHILG